MPKQKKVKAKKVKAVVSDFTTEKGRQAHIKRKLAKRAKKKAEREKKLAEEAKEVK